MGGAAVGQIAAALISRFWLLQPQAAYLSAGIRIGVALQAALLYGLIAFGLSRRWRPFVLGLGVAFFVMLGIDAGLSVALPRMKISADYALPYAYIAAMWTAVFCVGWACAGDRRCLSGFAGLAGSICIEYPGNFLIRLVPGLMFWTGSPMGFMAAPAILADGMLAGLGLGLGLWIVVGREHEKA